jgi:parvulin-like peptidyl-prolyl isomerase
MAQKKKEKRIKIKTILMAMGILVVGYVLVIGLLIYLLPRNENSLILGTTSIIPYPAAISNAGIITVGKLYDELQSSKRFYESQDFSQVGLRVDFSTEDGQKRLSIKEKNILNKLIDDSIIEAQAKKRGINITKDIVDQEVDRKLKEYGTGDYLKKNLEKLYGWDLDDFKENIVKPDLYRERLFAELKKTDPSYQEAQQKINQAKSELDSGSDFSTVAKKYSQGDSAQNGGALGWFSASQMLPEIAQAIFNFEKGQQSDVIESSVGYHIVKVEDVKTQDGEKMFNVRQIFIPTKNFSQWLEEFEKDYNVFIPMTRFTWDKQTEQVKFRNQSLNEYEQDLIENPVNDPTVLF